MKTCKRFCSHLELNAERIFRYVKKYIAYSSAVLFLNVRRILEIVEQVSAPELLTLGISVRLRIS
jgi:hypothetical protein